MKNRLFTLVLVVATSLSMSTSLAAQAMGGMGMASSQMSAFEKAKQDLFEAKNNVQKQKAIKVISRELATQYDRYLAESKSQIDQLQRRLDMLKKQLKLRVSAKSDLVQLEVTRIVNESKGLSWPGSRGGMSLGGMGMGGMGGMSLGGMGGMGMVGGMGMGAPGMGMGYTTTFEDDLDAEEIEDDIESSKKNFRSITLACLNYESANQQFPGNIADKDGKPLLSWRVAILPFLEQGELYHKFKLDEPWNSEHNIGLLAEMPDVFKSVGFDGNFKTLVQGFDGDGTVFEGGKNVTFGQMSDGSSNTGLLVEAAHDQAAFWSKPHDLEIDTDTRLKDLCLFRDTKLAIETDPGEPGIPMIHCVMTRCDGSVLTILKSIDESTLRNFVRYNDGTIINSDDRRSFAK